MGEEGRCRDDDAAAWRRDGGKQQRSECRDQGVGGVWAAVCGEVNGRGRGRAAARKARSVLGTAGPVRFAASSLLQANRKDDLINDPTTPSHCIAATTRTPCCRTRIEPFTMSAPSLAPYILKRPWLQRFLTPLANWYGNAAGYRQLGLRYACPRPGRLRLECYRRFHGSPIVTLRMVALTLYAPQGR